MFHAAPQAEQVSPYPGWTAAFHRIQAALARPGVVALVGPAGTGKTLMLRQLALHLVESGLVPAVLNHTTARHPRLPGHPDVILIDDADRLPAPILMALVRHGRPVVVVSGRALVGTLQAQGLHPTVVDLPLLSQEEARQFLLLQLQHAGQPAGLIQPAALVELHERSAGQPRSLQMLAGLAVFMARLADASQVTAAHVAQAALVQLGTEEEPEDEALLPDGPPGIGPTAPARPPIHAGPSPHRIRGRPGANGWVRAAALLGLVVAVGWPAPLLREVPPTAPGPVPAAPPPQVPPTIRSVAPVPLPPVTPVHVVVAYSGVAGAAAQAIVVADSLRRAGYPVDPPRMTAAREASGVSYVFAEDAVLAEALARATGLRATQLHPATPPRPGTIRVVPGPAPRPHDPDLLPARSTLP